MMKERRSTNVLPNAQRILSHCINVSPSIWPLALSGKSESPSAASSGGQQDAVKSGQHGRDVVKTMSNLTRRTPNDRGSE